MRIMEQVVWLKDPQPYVLVMTRWQPTDDVCFHITGPARSNGLKFPPSEMLPDNWEFIGVNHENA